MSGIVTRACGTTKVVRVEVVVDVLPARVNVQGSDLSVLGTSGTMFQSYQRESRYSKRE